MVPCGPFLADLLHITGQCAKFLLACHWRETTLKVASTDVVEEGRMCRRSLLVCLDAAKC